MTNDLYRRLREHDSNSSNVRTTSGKGPFMLIHAESHETRFSARKREKFWKSGVGRELRLELVRSMGL